MSKVYSGISAVILAGGRSSRLKIPKPFLKVKGKRIIDITLELLKSLFAEIFIVTNDLNRFAEFKEIKVAEDLVQDSGPLAGIYTGLKAISNNLGFFVACDMPFLQRGLIKRLLDAAAEDAYNAVVPYSERGIEPLHAVYSRRILAQVEESISRKELSMRQVLENCKCKYIKCRQGELSSFININTPQDLERICND